MGEELFNTNGAAKYLLVQPQTVRAWVCRGFLTPLKLRGWGLRFTKRELDKLLKPNDKKN